MQTEKEFGGEESSSWTGEGFERWLLSCARFKMTIPWLVGCVETKSRRGGFAATEGAPKKDVCLPCCVTLTAKGFSIGNAISGELSVKRECNYFEAMSWNVSFGVPQRAEAKCCPSSPGQRRNAHAESRISHVLSTTSHLQLSLNSS